jgi:hypothetical protein
MRDKILRLRIPYELFTRYKILCIQKELSLPKQTAELIRKFVEIHEENYDKIRKL